MAAGYVSMVASRLQSKPSSPRPSFGDYDPEDFSSDEGPSSRRSLTPKNRTISSDTTNSSSSATLTSAHPTPAQSRSTSPSRDFSRDYFYSEDEASYDSLMGHGTSSRFSKPSSTRKGWAEPRRRGGRHGRALPTWRRLTSFLLNSPLLPTRPATILLAVTVFLLCGLGITLFLIWFLNPDKSPLPWRSYCALSPTFPDEELAKYPPVGIFLGVMSYDSAVERRMLIRSTWAKHARSRGKRGATDRTIVRFILGTPQKEWARRVHLESETYKDIVFLPIAENMNKGKTHSFITWANQNAFVPAPRNNSGSDHYSPLSLLSPYPSSLDLSTTSEHRSISSQFPSFASNRRAAVPHFAPHDPLTAESKEQEWVRPQFVVKADDDSFVILQELEARLRLQWYGSITDATKLNPLFSTAAGSTDDSNAAVARPTDLPLRRTIERLPQRSTKIIIANGPSTSTVTQFWDEEAWYEAQHKEIDPMVYWGYLVKARFMAGELYALSSALVDYVATNPNVATSVNGAEDKVVARWMRNHPKASDVRWVSERCWIYDHPRAGTVYSHGFLFPNEVSRVRHETTHGLSPAEIHLLPQSTTVGDPSLTHSTVSRFGTRYIPPSYNLTTEQEVEALVEGSALSRLRDASEGGSNGEATDREVELAWRRRETRETRTGGHDVGGTVVVHFIKRNEWFLETALAFLEDEPAPPDANAPPLPPDDADRKLPSTVGGGHSTSGGGRPETDLSGKTPLDFSHLDEVVQRPKKPGHLTTDFSGKGGLDLSNLDGVESPGRPLSDDITMNMAATEDSSSKPSSGDAVQPLEFHAQPNPVEKSVRHPEASSSPIPVERGL